MHVQVNEPKDLIKRDWLKWGPECSKGTEREVPKAH